MGGGQIIQPTDANINQDFNIRIEGLKPFQKIKLEASTEDQKGVVWNSHAMFCADNQGIVDLHRYKPLENSSYEEVDPMGLFWSMLPKSEEVNSIFKCIDDRFVIDFNIYIEKKLVSHKKIIRFLKNPNVKRIEIRKDGITGTLFIPPSNKDLPVIITLSGSNGGLSEDRAKLLASNGFIVLALAYFRADNLPSALEEIPLEYFENVFSWLKNQSNSSASKVGLYGISRGAELSLLLGSFFPNSVQAIVAVAPSSVVYGSLGKSIVNAWTYQGKAILPFAHQSKLFSKGEGTPDNPIKTRENFLKGMKEKKVFEKASIPVEKIRCPILLISGGDDQMWPSDIYAKRIMKRLKNKNALIKCYHLNYQSAGHGINIPNLPIPDPVYYHPYGKSWFSMGGTRSFDARASQDSWNRIVDFFEEALK